MLLPQPRCTMVPMKRCIIRSFFIALLLLFVAGWGLSAIYLEQIGYAYDGRKIECATWRGLVLITFVQNDAYPRDGWGCDISYVPPARFLQSSENLPRCHTFLGFAFGHYENIIGQNLCG